MFFVNCNGTQAPYLHLLRNPNYFKPKSFPHTPTDSMIHSDTQKGNIRTRIVLTFQNMVHTTTQLFRTGRLLIVLPS
jgi:hypothetical protein